MRFGIILLLLIGAACVAGSVIPQGNTSAWYAENYPSAHGIIMALRLNEIFSSWYFITILVLLCMNLVFCSLARIRTIRNAAKKLDIRVSSLPDTVSLSPAGVEELEKHLRNIHCRETPMVSCTIYSKRLYGFYGSFITHLAILLVILSGAAALYVPHVIDRTCIPGQSLALDNGTRIEVSAFHIEDADGRLDYTSNICIVLPDGRSSGYRDISVNHPLSFGRYKVYQQTYGTAGSIRVTNLDTGGSDDFLMDEQSFLSLDGVSGLWYLALYPDYLKDPSGNITLISSVTGHYNNPVYEVLSVSEGVYAPVLAFPGEEMQIDRLLFHFNDPVEYPGLRIKETPPVVNTLLLLSFLLMIVGLFITFFCEPVIVKVDRDGYAVGGPKPDRMAMELDARFDNFKTHKEEDET